MLAHSSEVWLLTKNNKEQSLQRQNLTTLQLHTLEEQFTQAVDSTLF
jgi:hypothetical protein